MGVVENFIWKIDVDEVEGENHFVGNGLPSKSKVFLNTANSVVILVTVSFNYSVCVSLKSIQKTQSDHGVSMQE